MRFFKKTTKDRHLSFFITIAVILLLGALYWFTQTPTAPIGENNNTTEENSFSGPVGEPFITGPTEPPPGE